MSGRSVDFVVRDDSESKDGGDLTQVREYTRYLRSDGWDVRMVPYSPSMRLRQGAVVHLVNVDRPFDAYSTIRKAGDRPVFVSAIHHSLRAVRKMRRAESGLGVRSVVGRILPESLREYLAFVVRGLRRSTGFAGRVAVLREAAVLLPAVARCWVWLGRALDRVEAVFLLAEGERQSLARDTGWSGGNGVLTPNGMPGLATRTAPWGDRDDVVLVVGRVEPRKRQLELVRAASERGTPLRVVGPLVHPDSAFGAQFRAALRSAPTVEWLGALPHDAVLAEIDRAKVLVNASWVEVQSLVELEAAARGAWVVASASAGNSAEYLGDGFLGVEGDDVSEMLREAERLIAGGRAPRPFAYPWTWERAARVIATAYSTG